MLYFDSCLIACINKDFILMLYVCMYVCKNILFFFMTDSLFESTLVEYLFDLFLIKLLNFIMFSIC